MQEHGEKGYSNMMEICQQCSSSRAVCEKLKVTNCVLRSGALTDCSHLISYKLNILIMYFRC